MRDDPAGDATAARAVVTEIAWVNGRLVPSGEAALRPDDRGLAGLGAFEALKVVDGVPFALDRHLDRLVTSATPLGIPVDVEAITTGVAAILATTPSGAAPFWMRVTVTAGPARMASAAVATEPSVIVAIAPMVPWGPSADVVVVPWSRNENGAVAGLKTVSYVDNARAVRSAHECGADEGIFANTRGELCEGAGSNVFVVREGTVLTPPLSAGCLGGITRALLLEHMPTIV
jgi:branched-chain amino acid aminotransferase